MADNQFLHPFLFDSLFCLCFQKFVCNIYIKCHNSDSSWLYVHPLLRSLSNCTQQHTLHVIRCLTNGLAIKTAQTCEHKDAEGLQSAWHLTQHVTQCCYSSSKASFNISCTQHGSDRVWTQWHIHARKIGAAMRSKNSSQKHAATIFVNCEVCEWATQHVRLPLWLHKHILPVDNWFTNVVQTASQKNYKSISEKWQYANYILKLQWIRMPLQHVLSIQQFHLTFHQQ